MESHEILSGAADWLDANGWIRGTAFGEGRASACALGAMHIANTGGWREWDRAGKVFNSWLRCRTGWRWRWLFGSRIAKWNDFPGRTKAEVISELRACAAVEKAKMETANVVQSPKGMALAQA